MSASVQAVDTMRVLYAACRRTRKSCRVFSVDWTSAHTAHRSAATRRIAYELGWPRQSERRHRRRTDKVSYQRLCRQSDRVALDVDGYFVSSGTVGPWPINR